MATRLRGAIERGRQRRRTQRQLTSQEEAIRQADQSLYQSPHINPYQDTSRDNYRTYPYDYYCVDGNELIFVLRNGKYEYIPIKDFDEVNDKVLSYDLNGKAIFSKALLYKYDAPELLEVRSNGENHKITKGHKLINIDSSVNFNGKTPELGDTILDFRDKIPGSREYVYLDCRNVCKDISYFSDNNDGTFTIKGKGIKLSNRTKIPNTVFLDEDLAYVFGLFVAEGHLIDDHNRGSGRGYGVFFSLSHTEENIAKSIIKIIKSKFNIDGSYKIYEKYGCCSVRFFNKALTKIFRYIDFGTKCYCKKVPDIIFKTHNRNILKNFIAGCLVGDGTFSEYRISYKSTSYSLIMGLKLLLKINMINSNINPSSSNSWNLSIYSDNQSPLIDILCKRNWKHSSDIKEKFQNKRYYSKDKIFKKVSSKKLIHHDDIVYDLHTEYGNYVLGTIISHNSGTDCKVFYGDIWVDDVVSIQYTVNQSKTPIYGYAAQNYNAVAKGRVIVNGMLTIAFKETGYLNLIQRVAETQKNNAYKVIKRKVDVLQSKSEHRLAKFDPSLTYIGDQAPPGSTINTKINPNGSPQLIREQETIEEILLGKKAGSALVKNLNLREDVNLGDKDRDFEDFAELMEDSIWGDSNGRPYGITNLLKRADEFDYNARGGIEVGRGQGKNAEYDKVLNIMLTFGDINDFRAEHTLVLLNDVHFTDTSMIVSPDGTPIAESYAFFARDINRSISNEILQNINPIKLEVGVDDIELAKLEDIEAVEQKLNQAGSNEPWVVGIKPIAALNEFGWRPVDLEEIEVYLSMNRGIPLVDRVIEAAEKGFNDVQFADIVELDKTQYIADVFLGLDATLGESFTMVFEQSIPNTRTYRVIAPVRTGFRAPVVYTREDFFTDVGALPEPLEEVGGILDRNKQAIAAREAELAQDRENLNQERLSLGLQDETEEFQRRQADTARRQEQLADADTALGRAIRERQLNRAIRRENEAASELGQERARSLGERDLTRTERDRLHDLTNSYNSNAAEAQELIEDSETFNTSFEEYNRQKEAEVAESRKELYERVHAFNEAQVAEMARKERQDQINAANEDYKKAVAPIDEELNELSETQQQVQNRIEEVYRTAGRDPEDEAAQKEIKEIAKKATEEQNNLRVSTEDTRPSQLAFQTQSPLGDYSHYWSTKAPVDIAPISAGPFAGQVFIPASEEAVLRFNRSSIDVLDPQGQNFRVAHLDIQREYIGKEIATKEISGIKTTGGVFVSPLSEDPSSPKFTGEHGHFQELQGSVPEAFRINNQDSLQSYLQKQYEQNNIKYIILE